METKEIANYKWVEGYKAFLEKDGKLYGASQKSFEYQTENIMDEKDLQKCRRGFHFCKELKEVIYHNSFYPTEAPYKYYHVKGLVSECKENGHYQYLFTDPNKLVTHHLIILDEVSEKELFECMKEDQCYHYTILSDFPDEMLEECFKKIRSAHTRNELVNIRTALKEDLRNIRKQQLLDVGYSAPFADFLLKYKDSRYYFEKAIAMATEINDPAMRVMALLTEPNADE